LLLANSVDCKVARHLKKVGPKKAHGAEVLELQHAGVGLLSHLSGRLDVLETGRQEEHERSVMFAKKL